MNLNQIHFAQFTIDELIKDKPFILNLGLDQRELLISILKQTKVEQEFAYDLLLEIHDTNVAIEINEFNADKFYHILTSYLLESHKAVLIVESLKEVS